MRTHANEPQHADSALLTTIATAIKEAPTRAAAISAMLERLPEPGKRRDALMREAMQIVNHCHGDA